MSILKVEHALTGFVNRAEVFTNDSPHMPLNYILSKFQENSSSNPRAEIYDSIATSLADAPAHQGQ